MLNSDTMEIYTEEFWKKLKLTEKEEKGIVVDGEVLASKTMVGENCLIGRLCTARQCNFEALKNTMTRVWNPRCGLKTRDLGSNLFLFEFNNLSDRNRVLYNEPWAFDKHHLLLKRFEGELQPKEIQIFMTYFWVRIYDIPIVCDAEKLGIMVGNAIGTFVEMEQSGNEKWGRKDYLRIRVLVDSRKPLMRGMNITAGDGKKIWTYFRYERLSNFCFCCGVIGHAEWECEDALKAKERGSQTSNQYGAWLRANTLRQTTMAFNGGDDMGQDDNVSHSTERKTSKGQSSESHQPARTRGKDNGSQSSKGQTSGSKEENQGVESRRGNDDDHALVVVPVMESDNMEGIHGDGGRVEERGEPAYKTVENPNQCLLKETRIEAHEDAVGDISEKVGTVSKEINKQKRRSWKKRARKHEYSMVLSPSKRLLQKRAFQRDSLDPAEESSRKKVKWNPLQFDDSTSATKTTNLAVDGEDNHPRREL